MDTTLTPSCNVGRSANVSLERIQERKEFIIAACLAGLTKESILRQVNLLSDEKQWGKLGSVRSIERAIAGHFNEENRMSLPELQSYQAGLREAAFAQQELLIEKAVLHLYKTKEFQPFEYMQEILGIFRMMQRLVENRGWNYSKLPVKRMAQCGFIPQRRRNKDAWSAWSCHMEYERKREAEDTYNA